MFSCTKLSKVKAPRASKPRTLTEARRAELRERRRSETTATPPQQSCSSSLASDSEEVTYSATGCYVYKRVDASQHGSVVVHSIRPPQRLKPLEACRPPPLVLTVA